MFAQANRRRRTNVLFPDVVAITDGREIVVEAEVSTSKMFGLYCFGHRIR
jgi:hypothetical protein